MGDDAATNLQKSFTSGEPDVVDLGHDVFQIDTKMAGYAGITAGYLIRGSRPCLVETGTAPSAPVVRRALASLGVVDLGDGRRLDSHYGPASGVPEILDRSEEEIRVWVEHTRRARGLGLDLDHAVAMVRDQTLSRYKAYASDADPSLAGKFDEISGASSTVSGIWHWLDKLDA